MFAFHRPRSLNTCYRFHCLRSAITLWEREGGKDRVRWRRHERKREAKKSTQFRTKNGEPEWLISIFNQQRVERVAIHFFFAFGILSMFQFSMCVCCFTRSGEKVVINTTILLLCLFYCHFGRYIENQKPKRDKKRFDILLCCFFYISYWTGFFSSFFLSFYCLHRHTIYFVPYILPPNCFA